MTEDDASPAIVAILANVGAEICGPLDGLRKALDAIIADSEADLPPKLRTHAATMISLCEELRAMTRQTLGCGGSGHPRP